MSDTRVKICGITNPEDAAACHDLGADYLGLIFAPSSRHITTRLAQAIRARVPRANLVGVFVNSTLEDVIACYRAARLDLVQLHGTETPDYCAALRAAGAPALVKAFPSNDLPAPGLLAAYSSVNYVMFDLSKYTDTGNGARRGLWQAAATAGQAGHRVFLAGKLDPTNVAEAIRTTAPYGVDVCSGVEREPGRKDLAAVSRFIAAARQAAKEVDDAGR